MNYFKLLQIEQKYNINLKDLEHHYLQSLNKFHPDRAKTEQQKVEFLKYAIDINNAYNILKNEVKRAVYILSLHNIDIENAEIKNKFPTHILDRIWENFEYAEDTEEIETLNKFKNQKLEEKQNIILKITTALAKKELQKAAQHTIELKYFTNIIDNINTKIKNVID